MPALLNLQHMTKVTKLINPNFVNTNLNQSWAYECQTCVKWPPYGAKMLTWGVILGFLGTQKEILDANAHIWNGFGDQITSKDGFPVPIYGFWDVLGVRWTAKWDEKRT